ncbi:class I SAM-dependent methyltransferase [Paenibacillus dokdonensis]|uniref:class I SAM-dependent methyltransferase n=1 Tax=Paenibacillus dokdonensis TaxID=2567944 RepID=UPI0010A86EC6|nr:class I SAM-dependent methyltransferase [Paenibacillus dokdonensis]
MGTSNWQNLSYCVELIRQVAPGRILDVGVGFGRWGMICREFLDVWQGRVFREQWTTTIEGIEVFERSIDVYHDCFYNHIYHVDAYEFIVRQQNLMGYDLVILGDVLEHFTKQDAGELLRSCLEISRYVLLNIPIGDDWPQGSEYGNDYEIHRSEWTEAEFDVYPIVAKQMFKDYIQRDFATLLLRGNG